MKKKSNRIGWTKGSKLEKMLEKFNFKYNKIYYKLRNKLEKKVKSKYKLKDLTENEYLYLKEIGLLHTFYPSNAESWEDMVYMLEKGELKEK